MSKTDPNELLDNLRHMSSRLGDTAAKYPDNINFFDVRRMCEWFIELDLAIMDGKAPDSWSLKKFSKSDQSAYLDRMTRERDLTEEDERTLRDMLDSDSQTPS